MVRRRAVLIPPPSGHRSEGFTKADQAWHKPGHPDPGERKALRPDHGQLWVVLSLAMLRLTGRHRPLRPELLRACAAAIPAVQRDDLARCRVHRQPEPLWVRLLRRGAGS